MYCSLATVTWSVLLFVLFLFLLFILFLHADIGEQFSCTFWKLCCILDAHTWGDATRNWPSGRYAPCSWPWGGTLQSLACRSSSFNLHRPTTHQVSNEKKPHCIPFYWLVHRDPQPQWPLYSKIPIKIGSIVSSKAQTTRDFSLL